MDELQSVLAKYRGQEEQLCVSTAMCMSVQLILIAGHVHACEQLHATAGIA
jgi:hypothetical protein